MRKLLVATHGRFASGIMETFKLIMGENEDISEISAYVEPGFDMQKEAEKKIHELNEEDELIIVAVLWVAVSLIRFPHTFNLRRYIL